MDELNMDCQDVEKFYDTPKRIERDGTDYDFNKGYNLAYDEWEQHIKLKLDIDVLSSIIYHVMTSEGVLDFCEKDCNAIAKAIKSEISKGE